MVRRLIVSFGTWCWCVSRMWFWCVSRRVIAGALVVYTCVIRPLLSKSFQKESLVVASAEIAVMGRKSQGFQINAAQLEKAVVALKKYLGAQDAACMLSEDEDEFLYILVSLKSSHPTHRKDKPICVPLPHPLYTDEGVEVCLFVKDDKSGAGHKAAKKKLDKLADKAGISKVVGTSKLRTKYESFEAKRNLCRQFDIFLADERILPSLPKLIGKSFFKKKKQPIPIDLTVADWRSQIDRAKECTTMFLSGGSCLSIKVGRSSQEAKEVLANVEAVLAVVADKVPKKWDNVQAVYLKSSDSVALPVYQSLPPAAATIA